MFRCKGGGRDGRHVEMLKRTTSGDKGHSGESRTQEKALSLRQMMVDKGTRKG